MKMADNFDDIYSEKFWKFRENFFGTEILSTDLAERQVVFFCDKMRTRKVVEPYNFCISI